ncbi:PhzF family phenazine biosynthesis protein [Deinococcus deserti]|uniref:Putative Phenazine biosynthesis PhzC/PhzF protein n=1 Tax=Deinococcus deserti (strain DSM 17065 / CIP 109153 / LMG 22923 / VCD115) TaxID=546414 RepID=C1CVX5_DEIDV|nr:PhzF family phenazine biosynthesis protein [Deinococcus deserti]ACO46342.1 putative Phenazine biosynthesis PhzC/PhzF protein [Deinococcus deserti VCD115]
MTQPLPPARYRVFAPPGEQGGKLVAVQPAAGDEASTQAATTGTPLTAFVEAVEPGLVTLRLFTPTREKGASDSGAIAALAALQGQVPDALDVQMAGETQAAQLCGGEWLLMQGDVQVQATEADLSALGLNACPVWITSAGRPNLAVQLPDLDTLIAFVPQEQNISELNKATGTTGLLLFTPGGAPHAGMARADVSFRAFGPLKGFLEDAASSNMFACLTGVLSVAGLLPDTSDVIRGAQLMPGAPARLTAQFTPARDGAQGVWVGGGAAPVSL